MTERQRCQCTPDCPLMAEQGEIYSITHDPRPERQAERSRVMSERGALGGKAHGANKRAVAEEDVAAVDLRTPSGQLDVLESATRRVLASGNDPAKVATAVAALVKVAREVLETDTLAVENKELRALLLERHPELKKHLKAVP